MPNSAVADQHDPNTIITLDYKKESLEDFKVILRDILARNHLDNFTIAEDTEAENTVAILRRGSGTIRNICLQALWNHL